MNVTLNSPPYAASDRAKNLHQRLLVADLHADSLLWERDLLSRGSWGHVERFLERRNAIGLLRRYLP
jgi:hypothetical protein